MSIFRRIFAKHYIRQEFFKVHALVKEGRIALALAKIDVLHMEYPSHGSVLNEKGNIYAKYLGSGKRAYELYCQAVSIQRDCFHALINATDYSPTEEEFRKRSADALRRVWKPEFSTRIQEVLERLDSGIPYGVFLAAKASKDFELKRYGTSAAFAELLLDQDGIPDEEQLRTRRHRAQCLRELDMSAASSYSYRHKTFPATERLALLEAVCEIDKAIELDEYDHELWNLKAAWCVLLDRYEDALRSAEESLANAPGDYIKPFVNKIIALQGVGRENEISQCLEDALGRVDGDAANADIQIMKNNMQKKGYLS